MPLAPEVKEFLDQLAAAQAMPLHVMTPAQARRQLVAGTALLGTAETVHEVNDRRIPGPTGDLPLRIYRPSAESSLPAVVYFHGGGWVVGDLDTHDGYCRALANACGGVVVAVDYRLAPEHPYPAAIEDCFAATRWVHAHASELDVDSRRLAVAGDSAGGNLATCVTLAAREHGEPPLSCQVLLYPITDCNLETLSYEQNSDGYYLTRETMRWFWDLYAPQAGSRAQFLACPAAVPDVAGLPPALVVTAEYDPLRDEGEEWAARLQAAGVATSLTRYDGMIHGFIRRLNHWQAARDCLQEVALELRKHWSQ